MLTPHFFFFFLVVENFIQLRREQILVVPYVLECGVCVCGADRWSHHWKKKFVSCEGNLSDCYNKSTTERECFFSLCLNIVSRSLDCYIDCFFLKVIMIWCAILLLTYFIYLFFLTKTNLYHTNRDFKLCMEKKIRNCMTPYVSHVLLNTVCILLCIEKQRLQFPCTCTLLLKS